MSKKHKASQFEFGIAAEAFNLASEVVKVPVCRVCGRGMVGLTCQCADVRKDGQGVMLWLDGQEGSQA